MKKREREGDTDVREGNLGNYFDFRWSQNEGPREIRKFVREGTRIRVILSGIKRSCRKRENQGVG